MDIFKEEYSRHVGPYTLRCIVCGSPRGGVASNGYFYCVDHMPDGEILS